MCPTDAAALRDRSKYGPVDATRQSGLIFGFIIQQFRLKLGDLAENGVKWRVWSPINGGVRTGDQSVNQQICERSPRNCRRCTYVCTLNRGGPLGSWKSVKQRCQAREIGRASCREGV